LLWSYGKGEGEEEEVSVRVEVKSVSHSLGEIESDGLFVWLLAEIDVFGIHQTRDANVLSLSGVQTYKQTNKHQTLTGAITNRERIREC